ncbi:uncharacterized protein LOC124148073 [Haliotis rufescens]|uniref:uncharacterized protein LOC124148073 n=1 Tax=Haliotis rufescens TaxID=6454 RepID=UPI00201EC4B9|nr:uncharacterized protein LOC124148073 [Haliotis rufescens]
MASSGVDLGSSDEEDSTIRGRSDLREEEPGDNAAIARPTEHGPNPGDNTAIARPTEHGPGPGDNTAIARPTERQLVPGDHTEIAEAGSQSFVSRPRRGGPARVIIVANSKYVNISTGQMVPGTVGEDTLELRLIEAKKVFVETEIYRTMKQKVKQFGYVTLYGASGEGKTTMALMLSLRYRNRGYQVVFVDSIEKFDLDSCLSSTPRVFLIIDDMFGTAGLSTNVPLIKSFLNNLILHIDHCKQSREQMQSVRQDGGKSSHDDKRKGHTKDIRVIFTSKSYNFHDGLAQLHFSCFPLFGEQTIMNITLHDVHCLSPAEKQEIYERHKSMLDECSRDYLPEYRDLETDSKLFGFPLICKFASFSKNLRKLFKEPLSYLREELTDIINSKNDRSGVLVLMLLCEDRLKLTKLESEDEDQDLDTKVKHVIRLMPTATRSGMCQAARSFRGTYFTRGDTVGFAHSSIYDACACVLYNINPSFVLKHCSEDFLYERVQQETVQETKVDEHLHVISVSEEYHDLLTTRLAHSLKQGHFSKSVTHPILKQDKLSEQLLERLHVDGMKHDSTGNAWFHQREKGKYFLYWAVLGHNPYLVTNVENQTGEVFTQDEIREGLGGCAQVNNLTLLQWLLSRSDEHDRISRLNKLMLSAAENGSTETLLYLLNEGANPHTRDSMMQNIFHLVCKSRHENTLRALLNVSVDKHAIDSVDVDGHTPLMIAAVTGSEECFQLLTPFSNTGVQDTYGNSLINLACHGGNIAIVRHLLPSFDINKTGVKGWTPIMVAAVAGQKGVFDLLESAGADLSLASTSGHSLLHHACQGGNMAIVQHLLSDSNINQRGMHGWTPIMVAAVKGHKSVFDFLESAGADLSLASTSGHSLLHLACQGGNMTIVQHLMSDSNINQRGMHGWTPIMVAAVNGHKSLFDFLKSAGADLSLVDTDGDSLLHLACQGGNMTIVQHLMSDSNINQRGMDGWTPIMVAAVKGHKSVFDFLESKGADLSLFDTGGNSLLHLTCVGGNMTIIQHLLSDSNINQRGVNGWTPIMVAAVFGHKSVFDFLESKGADLSLVDTDGNSLLHLTCMRGYMTIVQHLLSDSNINQRGMNGWTPIMVAAVFGHKGVFDFLESKGADLSLVDTDGDSLLHLTCVGGYMTIVQHLLSDSNINQRGMKGRTPIMVAAVKGHKSVLDFLESKGADLSLFDTDGNSLLPLTCAEGSMTIVQHLLSESNINQRGMNGWTPIMAAAVFGHNSVFDLLESEGADLLLVDRDGDSLLHLACQEGNMTIVQHLLSDSNINQRGMKGRTPIMVAAFKGHKSVLGFLESEGADLSLVDTDGHSLLHLACAGGNMTIVKHLLSDSNINQRGMNGWTPIMVAAVFGHKSVFDFLESEGADLSLFDTTGDSLLHLASVGGNMTIVQHLLSDSNINQRGMKWRTPIMVAAVFGRNSVFDFLESEGADLSLVDTVGNSLLHLACQEGNMTVVQHLLSDANINQRGMNGWTPIMGAAAKGHKNVFDFLESKGADLLLADTTGNSLLHLACLGGNMTIVQHLLSKSNINQRGMNGMTPIMGANLSLADTSGNSLLHLACLGGNMTIVQHLLSDSNINQRGMKGLTPIMVAAVKGHNLVFNFLESAGADLSLVDTVGNSLLHLACQEGNMTVVQHLLSDANINQRGMNGWTPIMGAAAKGHKNVFDFLESKGADLSLADTTGNSLLHLACLGGNMTIVQHLLSESNINQRGMNGMTPIMVAAVKGHESVFDFLESKGADLSLADTTGNSLLNLACWGGNMTIVQHLLPDSNINQRGRNGSTPIMVAAVFGHKSVFDFLESEGADLSLADTTGNSLLHLTCVGGNMTIVQHLLSDSNINQRGMNGCTPIMVAAVNGHKSVFDFLESEGADLSLVDTDDNSLLNLCCAEGNMTIVQHLLSESNINQRGMKGRTPIMVAAFKGHNLVFNFLEPEGADLSLVDTDGNSLLHLACVGGNMTIVQHLLLSDSNINQRGMNGWTPIMFAAFQGHKSVLDFLESEGADLSLVDTDGNSLLHFACAGGNMTIVQHMLSDKL